MAAAERCGGCGMTTEEGYQVYAELTTCPTCEDRDVLIEQLQAEKRSTAGIRAGFESLDTVEDQIMLSSAATFTQAGAEAKARYRQSQRRTA